MSVCIVHLVRHGEHSLPRDCLAGRSAASLTEIGRAQSAVLADSLVASGAHAVLTSPVQRTMETATAIASVLGQAMKVEPGLAEIDFGAWEGLSFAALERTPGWDDWNRARSLARAPDGESMLAVQARAMTALLRARRPGGVIVAVSHADVIKAVLAYALGMPLDMLHRLEISLASRSVLVLGADWARVDAVNLPVETMLRG